MKKFRVEFNGSGFYSGAGVWETLDNFAEVTAENNQEAIELAKDWWRDFSDDRETAENEINGFAWRSSEISYDDDGYIMPYVWEFD